MSENKRYTWNNEDLMIDDNATSKQIEVIELTEIDVLLDLLNEQEEIITEQKEFLTRMGQGNHLKIIMEQKERIKELEQFINKLTTDGTGRIYLANGYAYKVSAVLTDYDGDVE